MIGYVSNGKMFLVNWHLSDSSDSTRWVTAAGGGGQRTRCVFTGTVRVCSVDTVFTRDVYRGTFTTLMCLLCVRSTNKRLALWNSFCVKESELPNKHDGPAYSERTADFTKEFKSKLLLNKVHSTDRCDEEFVRVQYESVRSVAESQCDLNVHCDSAVNTCDTC